MWSCNYETPVRSLAISEDKRGDCHEARREPKTGAKTQLLNTLSTLTQTHVSTFRHLEPEARVIEHRYY